MVEVHSSSRPGRPALLVFLTGLTLAGSLGLAWFQSGEKRSLGPPQRIAGTPLIVRPPRGWIPMPNGPGRFILTARNDPHGTEGALERQVAFRHDRQLAYVPPERLIRTWDRLQNAHSEEPVRTQIRGIPAIQVRRFQQQRAFERTYTQESILRVATHPRGDVIAVEYWTMMELTSADYELLESICAAIDFVDPELKRLGDDAKLHAGLVFQTPAGSSVVGPRCDGTAALHVVSNEPERSGAVAVARTWLAPGRTLADLLRDHIAAERGDWRAKARVLEWGRRDGVIVHAIYVPDPRYPKSEIIQAYALSTESGDAALVLPDPGSYPPEGLRLAARLADVVSFAAGFERLDPREAASDGAALAAKITEKGAMSWWGRGERRHDFLQEGQGSAMLARAADRSAAGGNASDGYSYRGSDISVDTAAKRYSRSRWTLDAGASGYQMTLDMGSEDPLLGGARSLMGEWTIREARTSGSTAVRREILRGTELIASRDFMPGAEFVAPPAEVIAEELVSSGNRDAVLVEVSHPLGLGSNSRLLRRLERDASGRTRVLRVDDYSPLGVVLTFDSVRGPMDRVIEGLIVPQTDPVKPLSPLLVRLHELIEKGR
jgi:hypothetical protein